MSVAGGTRGRRELFVWYRVEGDGDARLRDELGAMQRALEHACPGLRARLLVRADGSGAQTWMETYSMAAGTASGIDDALQARIAAAAAPWRDRFASDRHVESFEVVDGS